MLLDVSNIYAILSKQSLVRLCNNFQIYLCHHYGQIFAKIPCVYLGFSFVFRFYRLNFQSDFQTNLSYFSLGYYLEGRGNLAGDGKYFTGSFFNASSIKFRHMGAA